MVSTEKREVGGTVKTWSRQASLSVNCIPRPMNERVGKKKKTNMGVAGAAHAIYI